MKIGNFFDASANLVPVNPKPITINVVCSKDMLPNGQPNPGGRPVRGRGKAALVMMGGKDVLQSRVRSRQFLSDMIAPMAESPEALPPRTDDGDERIALMYEQLSRIVREWDEATQVVGGQLFPSAEAALELVTFEEANRIMAEYQKYMSDEHPKEVDAATRTKSAGRSVRVGAGPPR